MGNTIMHEEIITNENRLMCNRLAVDICENIHLHYRDIRVEYSLNEWEEFAAFILKASEFIKSNYSKAGNNFKQISTEISDKSDYWNGRINVEKQGAPFDDIIHIHYNDMRLELPKSMFIEFFHVINKGNEKFWREYGKYN
jgi:hypothetical protein